MKNDFINFYVTPSIIQQFHLNPQWGVRAWLSTLGLIKSQSNYFTRYGQYMHNKLGYTNNKRFYTVFNVKDLNVFMEGTPDHLNPLKELKTCGYRKIQDKKELNKIIDAASLQLMGYMMMTKDDYGFVVVCCRDRKIPSIETKVERNDKLFKCRVYDFYKYLSNNLSRYMEVV